MRNIVCYGDSNTWGFEPGTAARYSWNERWTGVLQRALGPDYRVNEEGLSGRTTSYPDPLSPGRNGMEFLPVVLDTHTPIDLLIIMLGTNDTKKHLGLSAFAIAHGAAKLVEIATPCVSKILLISPLPIVPTANQHITLSFEGAIEKSEECAAHYQQFAAELGCHFLDGSTVGSGSPIDGIHLDRETHRALGERVAETVKQII